MICPRLWMYDGLGILWHHTVAGIVGERVGD
jgi:hypothetical protein